MGWRAVTVLAAGLSLALAATACRGTPVAVKGPAGQSWAVAVAFGSPLAHP